MNKKYSFISILTTDDYLDGLLVLFYSIQKTKSSFPFIVLITPNISISTINKIEYHSIPYKIIESNIENPTDIDKNHRWFSTYSKLHTFNQTEFDKLIYLDADMLVLKNIDELFNFQHMSAVKDGGVLPRKSLCKGFNTGLLVIEPSKIIFEDMLNKVGKIEKNKTGNSNQERPAHGSDQDFLNIYYNNWSEKNKLHLNPKYNMLHYQLDEHNSLFKYNISNINVLHYASSIKPWNSDPKINNLLKNKTKSLEIDCIELWSKFYNEILPL